MHCISSFFVMAFILMNERCLVSKVDDGIDEWKLGAVDEGFKVFRCFIGNAGLLDQRWCCLKVQGFLLELVQPTTSSFPPEGLAYPEWHCAIQNPLTELVVFCTYYV